MSDQKVKVVKGGDEMQAQTESSPTMTVGFLEQPEHLEPTDDVLYGDALAGEVLVSLDWFRGKGVLLAFAVGDAAVGVLMLDTLIAPIG